MRLWIFLILPFFVQGRISDTTKTSFLRKISPYIVPTVFVGYGVVGLKNKEIQRWDREIRLTIKGDKPFRIDDWTQAVPYVAVYGLNVAGIKGKHSFGERTLIMGTALLIMTPVVFGVKKLTAIERPDGSARTAFPSGHTAAAFTGAEFLYQEYKEVSPWIGVAGYCLAATTGFFRIYNDRHWFTDVVAGAGTGILATKIAYLIFPYLNKKLFLNSHASLLPFYNGRNLGISWAVVF